MQGHDLTGYLVGLLSQKLPIPTIYSTQARPKAHP